MNQAVPPFWAEPVDGLLASLQTSPQGLTGAEASARLRSVGPNLVRDTPAASTLRLLVRQFESPLVLVLIGAACVSAAVGEWTDAEIILAIVLGAGLVGFVQEHRAATALARLRARVETRSTVLRDGAPREIPSREVVPGDVALLAAGSLVPGDGRILAAADCSVSEAVLTGEPVPSEKRPGIVAAEAPLGARDNAAFMGSYVRSGTARFLVVRTGAATEFGAIADRLRLDAPESEFARGLRDYGFLLTRIMGLLALIVFSTNVVLERPPIDSLLFAIALAVGMSPELLPAIVTVTLATGARLMAGRGVIVRKLEAVENLGAMEVLCTDKTGTLTEGSMALVAALDPDGAPSDAVLRDAFANAALQSGLPNLLDEALIAAGRARGLDAAIFRRLGEAPFDFKRRRLSVLVAGDAGGAPRLVTKGAFAETLAACDRVGDAPLGPAERASLEAHLAAWSGEGLRVLGVASREMPGAADCTREDERTMRLEGVLLFRDPPKAEVAETIAALRARGVELKIITGDNRFAAAALARTVGIAHPAVLTGAELDRTRDEALWRRAEATQVFAEIDPIQKERIIVALKRAGRVTGYLGDGINDAPALRAADVGVSVDQAVDVAKEAADLVLLEHDLGVLLQGIELGRRTFVNTLKYIAVTTSANFGNMLSMAAASVFLPFLPLLAKQILLNNFLSDFPALAIAGDRADPEAVARPSRWDIRRIRRVMLVFGSVSTAFDFVTFAVLLGVFTAGPELFRTAWFTESLLTEILIIFVLRTRRPIWRSRPGALLAVAAGLVGLAALGLSYIEPAAALGFTPLPWPVLAAVLAISATYAAASEAAKAVLGRWDRAHGGRRRRGRGLPAVRARVHGETGRKNR